MKFRNLAKKVGIGLSIDIFFGGGELRSAL